jgi:hypothetical protein
MWDSADTLSSPDASAAGDLRIAAAPLASRQPPKLPQRHKRSLGRAEKVLTLRWAAQQIPQYTYHGGRARDIEAETPQDEAVDAPT